MFKKEILMKKWPKQRKLEKAKNELAKNPLKQHILQIMFGWKTCPLDLKVISL